LNAINLVAIRGVDSVNIHMDTRARVNAPGVAIEGLDFEAASQVATFTAVDGQIPAQSTSSVVSFDTLVNDMREQDATFELAVSQIIATTSVQVNPASQFTKLLTVLDAGNVRPVRVTAFNCGAPFTWVPSVADTVKVGLGYNFGNGWTFAGEAVGFSHELTQDIRYCFDSIDSLTYSATVTETGATIEIPESGVFTFGSETLGWELSSGLLEVTISITAQDSTGNTATLNVQVGVLVNSDTLDNFHQDGVSVTPEGSYFSSYIVQVDAIDYVSDACRTYNSINGGIVTGEIDCCHVQQVGTASIRGVDVKYCTFDDLVYPFTHYDMNFVAEATVWGTSKVCVGILSDDENQCFFVNTSPRVTLNVIPHQYVLGGAPWSVDVVLASQGAENLIHTVEAMPDQAGYLTITVNGNVATISSDGTAPVSTFELEATARSSEIDEQADSFYSTGSSAGTTFKIMAL